MKRRLLRCGLRISILAMLLLSLGCPPAPVPTCTEADLQNLRYSDMPVGGDASRVVFERAGYPVRFCWPPRNATSYSLPPAERTWVVVDVPDLTLTTVSPPLPGPVNYIITDGHWAVIDDHEYDVVTLRDLDTGGELTLVEGINEPYQFSVAVSRPYVIIQDFHGGTVLNAETDISRRIPSTLEPSAISGHLVAYAEFVNPGSGDLIARLKLLDLDTDEEIIVKDPVPYIEQLEVFSSRIVWVENSGDFSTKTVLVYDIQSTVTSPLVTVVRQSDDFQDRADVADIGEAGVLIWREHDDGGWNEPTVETTELMRYDGSTGTIAVRELRIGVGSVAGARFAGPYVVYHAEDTGWLIYNPADDSTLQIEPFP